VSLVKPVIGASYLVGAVVLLFGGSARFVGALPLIGSYLGTRRYNVHPVECIAESWQLLPELAKGHRSDAIALGIAETAIQVATGQGLDVDEYSKGRWQKEIVKRSKVVFGKSGAGKTSYMLHDVFEFKRQYPNGKLIIIDLDYGHSHEGREPNTWYTLPTYNGKNESEAVVYVTLRDALTAIDAVEHEFNTRIRDRGDRLSQQKKFDEPWLLVIDEEPGIAGDLKEKTEEGAEKSELEAFLFFIDQILRRGKKQGMYALIGTQSLAVGSTKIHTDSLAQYDLVCLGKSVKNTKYLNWAGIVGDERKQVLQVIEAMEKQYARLAVVRDDDEISVRVVPEFDPSLDVDVQVFDSIAREELNEFLQPEAMQRIKEAIANGESKTAASRAFNLRRSLDDPRYRQFTEVWDALNEELEQIEQVA